MATKLPRVISPIEEKVKTVLAEFIETSVGRYLEQIERQRAYFAKWTNKEIEAGDYPSDSWFYPNQFGRAYHKLEDGSDDYSKPMRKFRQWSLTKAGYNYAAVLRMKDEKLVELYKEDLTAKIVRALTKHEATDFVPVIVQKSALGIEGTYQIGGGRMATFSAITAGGYNIQCFHYRYTVKIIK